MVITGGLRLPITVTHGKEPPEPKNDLDGMAKRQVFALTGSRTPDPPVAQPVA